MSFRLARRTMFRKLSWFHPQLLFVLIRVGPKIESKMRVAGQTKNLCIKNEVSNIIFTFFITQKYPSILQFIINSYKLINTTRED